MVGSGGIDRLSRKKLREIAVFVACSVVLEGSIVGEKLFSMLFLGRLVRHFVSCRTCRRNDV